MEIIRISLRRELITRAAEWFSSKWGIPYEEYLKSMEESSGSGVPEWYLAMERDEIMGGMGVIENDFHERTDLAPNVCAVYVDEKYRCQGIAGSLLDFVCRDMAEKGHDTLYLVTNHTGFYERYGWKYLCPVKCSGGETSKIYMHR